MCITLRFQHVTSTSLCLHFYRLHQVTEITYVTRYKTMSSRYFKFVVGIYFLAIIAGCGNSTPEDASPDLGSATPTSHSPWSPNTSYLVNDTVVYDGQIYINVQATVGSEPPSSDSSHWTLVTSSSQASPSVPDENETVQEFSKLTGNDGEIGPPGCLLYTSPSPRDATLSRMPSSA